MSSYQSNPNSPRRRTVRLPTWDYRTHAFYFVTICTHQRDNLFTDSRLADIAALMWPLIPTHPHAKGVLLDEWVIMPNHLHGLLLLPGPPTESTAEDQGIVAPGLPFDIRYVAQPESDRRSGDRPTLIPGSLGAIIGSYKSGVTRRINAIRRTPGHRVWQRGFYEHIVRDHHELSRIQNYIIENPARWAEDRDNLAAVLERMTHRDTA